MRRDGDLIPFSMTIGLLPISTRIVASLVLKWYLLMSVVLVPLLGELCCEIALPLISVDLAPRVGGLGANLFQESLGDKNEGASGPGAGAHALVPLALETAT